MRAVFAIVWFVLLYMGALKGVGWAASQVAAQQTGSTVMAQRAGKRFAAEYHAYVMAASGLVTIAASGAGILPGTKVD